MATISPASAASTAAATTATGAPVKLRDSCNSCAVSKVRCNKGKPVCARCAKRGMRCEYFATKRAGRKHDSQSSAAIARRDKIQAEAQNVTTAAKPAQPMDWDMSLSHEVTYPSPPSTMTADVRSIPPDDTASWWLMNPSSPEANDWFASPVSLSLAHTPKPDPSQHGDFDVVSELAKNPTLRGDAMSFDIGDLSTFLDCETPLILNDSSSDTSYQSKPPSSRNSSCISSSMSSSTLSSLSVPPTEASTCYNFHSASPHCCLIRAMDLLKKLFPGSVGCNCQGVATGDQHAHHQMPTIDSVVLENKHTLEAIHGILQCPCSGGSPYLLAIIALVIFKVLGWYRAAVHDVPTADALTENANADSAQAATENPQLPAQNTRRRSCHSDQVLRTSTVIGGYRLEGDDHPRMAAQLVLSELHRVQRLINELASRLKPEDGATSSCEVPFFSPTWFGQLETDLRNRVRALSLEIVDMLK